MKYQACPVIVSVHNLPRDALRPKLKQREGTEAFAW
jgi:hypothetical protein